MSFIKRDKETIEEAPVEVIEVADALVEESLSEDGARLAEIPVEPAEDVPMDEPVDEPVGGVELEQPCGEVDIADESTLSIDGGVVEKIVAMTCREVDGVLQLKGNLINSLQGGLRGNDVTKGVSVEMFGDDACTVHVAVILEFGKSAPRVFQELHDKVASAIESMTGLKVNAVNVRVTNVLTRAEAEGGKRKDKAEA